MMMLAVVWNPHRFDLIDAPPKSSKFNAEHYISHILSRLLEILALSQDDPRRHFVIHAGNARPRCAKTAALLLDHNSLRPASYPPDSPDRAPSDFGIFEYVKGVLRGSSFNEHDEFLSVIQEIIRRVDRETLDAEFQE
jgi:hypothetical protein